MILITGFASHSMFGSGILAGIYLCMIRGKKGFAEQIIVNKIIMLIMFTSH